MWRLVDIAGEDRRLSLSRNAMVVRSGDAEIGRLHLGDLNAVVVHALRASITTDLAAALAAQNIPVVLCDAKHMPSSIVWPVEGHFEQADRMEAQAAATLPLRKRLWQVLVKAKLNAQATALAPHDGVGARALSVLARKVRSGDPDNLEAQGARLYWPRMLGSDFRRDPAGEGLNLPLNYGYIVLRSAMARAVAAAGLMPALGLHHRNRRNPFRLVDDLMEPFRPLVDRLVRENRKAWNGELSPEARIALAGLLTGGIRTDEGVVPVYRAVGALAHSLVGVYGRQRTTLALPRSIRIESQMELDGIVGAS